MLFGGENERVEVSKVCDQGEACFARTSLDPHGRQPPPYDLIHPGLPWAREQLFSTFYIT